MMSRHSQKTETDRNPLRIGCINIMPEAHSYEPFILSALSRTGFEISVRWIRLESHAYRSTPPGHLTKHYTTFSQVLATGELDGLLLTGAPVETLSFSVIRYWGELREILACARERIPGTLGLCWGAIALAKIIGMKPEVYDKKIFGVFPGYSLLPTISLGDENGKFYCPHSRFAGISAGEFGRATRRGNVRILASGPETGPVVFECEESRFLCHLGHPEYPASRLADEWRRDRKKGRQNVPPPVNFEPEQPETTWKIHTKSFFSYWLEQLRKQKEVTENNLARAAGRGKQ